MTVGRVYGCALVILVAAGIPAPVIARAGSAGDPAVAAPSSQPAAPREGSEPRPEGLARLGGNWPSWLTVTFVDRVRVESPRSPAARDGSADTYVLNRFRLTAIATLAPWARVTVQGQDSRAGGYEASPVPKSVENHFDLRLASVTLTKKGRRSVSLAAGRQELNLGDRRLVASPDWGNVGRTYDGLRVTGKAPGLTVDGFAVAPVDVGTGGFSRPKHGERAYGMWTTFDRLKRLAYLDVYEVVKYNDTAIGETGSRGSQVVYTTGARAGGPIWRAMSFETDVAVQRGHSASDGLAAWGTHQGVSWRIGPRRLSARLSAEYNFASGDSNPSDGTRKTFDQLYASTHGVWGLADQVGWRNMHHAAVKVELSPVSALRVGGGVNRLALATVNDAWYGVSGSKVALNRAATSRDLGWEPDLWANVAVSRDLSVGAGVAVLLGGDYVRQTTGVARIWTPYVMSTYKF